ncbi:hypothetical protein IL306_009964 [Fusarium sp. DS 682]|nr:hypothetical protein IL306_009964 [Fusarium sp. DS 682]
MAPTQSIASVDCAVFFGHHGPLIASGDKIGLGTKIKAQLLSIKAPDCDPWIGLALEFPLGKDQKANEEAGFGVRYRAPEHGSLDTSKLYDYHQIRIKFPRSFYYEIQEGEAPSTITNEHLSYVKIHFGEAQATIEGFGIPFANREDPQVEGWVNERVPISGMHDLLDILQQKILYLILPSKSSLVKILGTTHRSSSFRYPYSEDISWDLTRFEKEIQDNKGYQLAPLYSHPTDVSHTTAVSQSVIQDVLWLRRAAERVGHSDTMLDFGLKFPKRKDTRMPAYFFRCKVPDTGVKDCLHLVIPFPESLVNAIGPSWKLLIEQRNFWLKVYTSRESEESTSRKWFCRIAPLGRLDRYARHRKSATDVILIVEPYTYKKTYHDTISGGPYIPINYGHDPDLDKFKTFTDRQTASEALLNGDNSWNYVSLGFDLKIDQCERKFEAVHSFHPQANPSNPIACGLPTKRASRDDGPTEDLLDGMTQEQKLLLDKVKDKMELQRAILRGAGFYDWMMKTDGTSKWRPLPTVNFLDTDDQTCVDTIIETALPKYRARLRSYLSNRPLGIGIITGAPGSGKTTIGATAALALQAKVGKILCSGPTDIVVDNFAYHLDKQTWNITERLNAGKSLDDSSRYRRKLVVRPYSFSEELNAFYMLLTKPELGKEVLEDWKFLGKPNEPVNWKFHLSAAYWLLLLFRSPAVDRSLGPDDSLVLHKMQQEIDEDPYLEPIRDNFPEAISEYLDGHFDDLLEMLLDGADMLCITPCASTKRRGEGTYETWKKRLAHGVVVDQAGTMDRPDLYRVWGNTLIPCCLVGDTRSEQPIVRSVSEKEPASENYYNRFAKDGQISGLEFLQASGLPVFRLDTQVRTVKGMYDLASEIFYPELPLRYHTSLAMEDKRLDVGRELEAYARMKYPELRKPPEDIRHQPIFVHRQDSTIYQDSDGSQACQEQDSAVLSFIAGLVTHSVIEPAQIVILTPWAANATLIERKRSQKKFELLKNMPEATTIESYRGREADIVFIVMSTTRDTGPSITTDEQLLITMLTRHKSGLVIFGDICASGVIGEDRNGKFFKINNKPGQELSALQRIDEKLFDDGRVVTFSTELKKRW